MYGHPRPQIPYMPWGYQRPPHSPQWRHPGGPRGPFYGQRQRFQQPRLPFQPGNDNYWCETCDRGFATEDILNKHKLQHQKCNIDGCQFIAHPKVITKHIQMQHSTGLYKKIANLKNPEDIEKWREERRKKYPTKVNIDKKAAELKEKIDRGEKMGLERERNYHTRPKYNQEYKQVSGQGAKRSNMRNENQPRSKIRRNNPTENKFNKQPKNHTPKTITENKQLKPFAGILNLEMDSDKVEIEPTELNDLIEDDEDCKELISTDINETPAINTEPVVCGALSSLMCDYGSSDDEENNEISKTKIKQTNQLSEDVQTHIDMKSNQITVADSSSILGVSKCISDGYKVSIDSNHTRTVNGDENLLNFKVPRDSTDGIISTCTVITPNGSELNPVDKETISTLISNEIKCSDHKDKQDNLKAEAECSISTKQLCEINECVEKVKEINQVPISNEDDSDSGPEEVKVEVRKEDNLPAVLKDSKPKDVRKKLTRGRMQVNQRRKPKLPSTLLQKLLFKEMKQERNIVLQCIRYIRRNNYFDKNE